MKANNYTLQMAQSHLQCVADLRFTPCKVKYTYCNVSSIMKKIVVSELKGGHKW